MIKKLKNVCKVENLPFLGFLLSLTVFIPFSNPLPLSYALLLVTFGIFVLYMLRVLLKGQLRHIEVLPLKIMLAFWIVMLLSALLTPGIIHSVFGDLGAADSLLFIGVLTFTGIFLANSSKQDIFKKLVAFIQIAFAVNLLYLIYNILMPSVLFGTTTATVFNSSFDLSIFSALVLVGGLLVRYDSKLKRVLSVTVSVAAFALLLIMSNFYDAWIVVLVASLLSLLFYKGYGNKKKTQVISSDLRLWALRLLPVFSVATLLFGSYIFFTGVYLTGVSFVDKRPNVVASLDVLNNSQTSIKNKLLGTGPDSFSTDWFSYRSDSSVNLTRYWDTSFPAARTSILHNIISFGWIGGALWVVLLLSLLAYLPKFLLVTSYKRKAKGELISSYIFLLAVLTAFVVASPGYLILTTFYLAIAAFVYHLRKEGLVGEADTAKEPSTRARFRKYACLSGSGAVSVLSVYAGMATVLSMLVLLIAPVFVDMSKAGALVSLAKTQRLLMPFDVNSHVALAQVKELELNKLLQETSKNSKNKDSLRLASAVESVVSPYKNATFIHPQDYRLWLYLSKAETAKYLILKDEQDLKQAEKDLSRAFNLAHLNPAVSYAAANIALAKKDTKALQAALLRTLALKPNFEPAYRDLFNLAISSKDLKTAYKVAYSAVQNEPSSPEAWNRLALIDYQLANYKAAVDASNKAMYLYGQTGTVPLNTLYVHAFALSKIGQKAQAVKELNVLAKKTGSKDIIKLLKALQKEERDSQNSSQDSSQEAESSSSGTKSDKKDEKDNKDTDK